MSRISRSAYALAVVISAWPCAVSVRPVAARDVPFVVTYDPANEPREVVCSGPYFRTGSVLLEPGTEGDHLRFYSFNSDEIFDPFGNWTCRLWLPGDLNPIDRKDFCLARTAPEVDISLEGIVPALETLRVAAEPCPPRSLPPPALTQLEGSANRVGAGDGHSNVSLSGTFQRGKTIALDRATVTIDGLLHEVDGAGELVSGLPMVLSARSGSTPNAATYESLTKGSPRVRVDVRRSKKAPDSLPGTFRLSIQGATIADFPQNCSPGPDSTTPLAIRLTIDDGVNVPLILDGAGAWRCLGKDPQAPTSLKTHQLLSVVVSPPTP